MKALQSKNHLDKKLPDRFLRNLLSSSLTMFNLLKEITTIAQLHYDAKRLGGFIKK